MKLMECVKDAENDCDTDVESESLTVMECVCEPELETEVDGVELVETLIDNKIETDAELDHDVL